MDLVQTIRKEELMLTVHSEGSRGGRAQFSWEDVKGDQNRENYLGHSLMAPVGRWQKNRDLNWYAKADEHGQKTSVAEARVLEIKKVKEAEDDAIARALGIEPPSRDSNANEVEIENNRLQLHDYEPRTTDGRQRRARSPDHIRKAQRPPRKADTDGRPRRHRRSRTRSRSRSRSQDRSKRRSDQYKAGRHRGSDRKHERRSDSPCASMSRDHDLNHRSRHGEYRNRENAGSATEVSRATSSKQFDHSYHRRESVVRRNIHARHKDSCGSRNRSRTRSSSPWRNRYP